MSVASVGHRWAGKNILPKHQQLGKYIDFFHLSTKAESPTEARSDFMANIGLVEDFLIIN